MTIAARYENGVFRPLEGVRIEEGIGVEVDLRPENPRPRSIADLGFAGMWEYRDDIEDGVSYVKRLRDNPRATRDSDPKE
jgi:predicted DNA-binding antitoxin AbrB/MazE fold protein